MAVYQSPFSKKPQSSAPPPPIGTPDDSKAWDVSDVVADFSGVVGDDKTSKEEEQYKLDRAYDTAKLKILSTVADPKKRKDALKRLEASYKVGAIGKKGFITDVGGFTGAITNAPKNIIGGIFKGAAIASRGVQSAAKESLDALEAALGKGPISQAIGTYATGPFSMLRSLEDTVATEKRKVEKAAEKPQFSWNELKSQTLDPKFRVFNSGHKAIDAIVDFGVDVAFDPTTYVGAGAVNYAGKAGRIALATRFATAEMRAKYPSIVLNDVMRFGAGAIPKAIRDAEGISYGVKFAGKALPGSAKVADVVAGKYGVLSNARALTGDFVAASPGLRAVREAVARGSTKGFVKIGAGRAGAAAAEESEIVKHIADLSSARYAKGAKVQFNDDSLFKIKGTVDRIVENGWGPEITRLVEDPVARATAPKELREAAEEIVAWQKELRDGVNAIYSKFNVDFGGTISEIGFVDDYIHHKLTREALEEIANPRSRFAGFFRSADLTDAELGRSTGAALYRKYRPGESFMGRELKTGSIDEINRIFDEETGGRGLKFFEDDPASIVESYAYSMAAARGREAYIRRAMDFGSDIIKVVNKKTIPDGALLAETLKTYRAIQAARRALHKEVLGLRKQAYGSAEEAVAAAQKILDGKDGAAARVAGKADRVLAQIGVIEAQMVDVLQQAANRNVEQRGVFLEVHKAMMEELEVLKRAVQADRVSEDAAMDIIRDVYKQVFPEAKRIPKDPSRALNAIKRAKGMAGSAEIDDLVRQRDAAARQIADGDYGSPEELNDLLDIEVRLNDDIDALTTMDEVAREATYAEDGLLYGEWDSLTARSYDPTTDPKPYRTLDSRPLFRSGGEVTTDEIMAARQAFKETEGSVAVHALGADEVIDLRDPEMWYSFLDNEGPIGEAVAQALAAGGADANAFLEAWTTLIRTGEIDPMFAEVFPELADLIDQIGLTGAKVFDTGVVPDDYIVQVFDTISDSFLQVARSTGADNPEQLSEFMFDAFIRSMVNESGNTAPVLFPSQVIYGARNNMAEGAYSVVLPDSWSYVDRYPPGDVVGAPTSPVRFTRDDALVSQIMDGSLADAEWAVTQQLDSVASEVVEATTRSIAREALEQEIRDTGRKIGAKKGAATKRVARAQRAADEYAKTGKFKVKIDGTVRTVTREEALDLIAKRETKLVREQLKMEERLARATGRELAPLEARKRNIQARLAALMDEKKVLQRWNERTGDALREEIGLALDAIGVEPPRGYAGVQSRQWADKVRTRLANIQKMAGDSRPAVRAYERVVTQMHAAEAALSQLDMFEIPMIEARLQGVRAGTYMPKVVDDIEDGWKVIERMGVQVPSDVYDIMMPNIRRLRDPKEANKFFEALNYVNRLFTTYAIATPGFVVRNAISAVFMNVAGGVRSELVKDGARAITAYLKHGPIRQVNGKTVGWLVEMGVDPAEWPVWEEAFRATKATSRGMMRELAGPAHKGRVSELLLNNKYTRLIRKSNEATEFGVRFPMALDTLKRGGTYDDAVTRVNKYHFDYDDLSKLDEAMMKVVPFWIWTSRNIPLQMTEQLLRPQAYSVYNQIQSRNEVGGEVVMPLWMSEANPIPLGGDKMLMPDLPHLRLEQQARAFTEPTRLIGQMYPTFKLPIEMIANKQVAMDIPFSENYEQARGLDALIAKLGEVSGRDWISRRDPETGKLTINPKASYAIGNLLPVIATTQRLSGGALGGKANYGDRQLQSLLNSLGIPYKETGPYERGELIGRQFKIKDLMNQLVKQGIVPKED